MRIDAREHGNSRLHVSQKLPRDVVRLVARVERNDADIALLKQSRNLRRFDFFVKQNIVETFAFDRRGKPCGVAAAADKQETDVPAVAHAHEQIDEDIHPLRYAHVSRIYEDLASSQPRFRNIDRATDRRRGTQPILQHLERTSCFHRPF